MSILLNKPKPDSQQYLLDLLYQLHRCTAGTELYIGEVIQCNDTGHEIKVYAIIRSRFVRRTSLPEDKYDHAHDVMCNINGFVMRSGLSTAEVIELLDTEDVRANLIDHPGHDYRIFREGNDMKAWFTD